MFGLPYASAGVDMVGYHVKCPECGFIARGGGSINEMTDEDRATKGAARVYALHYELAHPVGCLGSDCACGSCSLNPQSMVN